MSKQDDRPQPGPQKLPYEPPQATWEDSMEVEANLASACDKVGGEGGLCDIGASS
jgi:hypothetical protein